MFSKRKSPGASQDGNRGSEDKSNSKDVSSTDSDSKSDVPPLSESDDTGYKIENRGSSEEENDDIDSEMGRSEAQTSRAVSYPKGVRQSERLTGVPNHSVQENRAKQRLRQRPTRNSAMESIVIPDSEDEQGGKTDLSESS